MIVVTDKEITQERKIHNHTDTHTHTTKFIPRVKTQDRLNPMSHILIILSLIAKIKQVFFLLLILFSIYIFKYNRVDEK
jgi:hypothetical protein